MNENEKKKAFGLVGLIFILIGSGLIIYSFFCIAIYDKCEGELYVTTKGRNQIAYITYEYDGRIYENIAVPYYNAFTMKNGKTCTVYISSDSPDKPKTTIWGLGVFTVLIGMFALKPNGSKTEIDM